MEEFRSYNLGAPVKKELNVNFSKRRGRVTGILNIYKYVDKDTQQHVVYIPSLEISGYGETPAKAEELAEFIIQDWISHLKNLSPDKIRKELSELGWKKAGLFNKQFLRAYLDDSVKLQNLNAVDDKVERLSLIAA